ncbi:MAG: DUF420 domain-containing protein [Saprospiraceae bacterium]|jgi:putative membrane protein|nr:DUF420 domain-containing protein [Candidatus Parvibacillus calidus]MBX2936487.1 DUF420 domain-containing protein [Saprospiraceae bacterium]MBX7179153.1 DUF420 domain-containing protein [Saprospiraceae bacterium]MCB0590444.1 DUF420 domain-containing protein [Saprospiraceae bacterium]MCO6471749.1 DUF420 domain-containing protein [Saprospiraceae bacterium]
MEYTQAKKKERKLNRLAWVISLIVFLTIIFMRRIHFDVGMDMRFLAPFHSSVNAITFLVLLFAFYQIKQKNIKGHQKAINLALVLSCIFLVSYVLYHITTPERKFCHEGVIRIIYFFLLISHIVLAAVILPFILFTYTRAFTGQYERHKKLARYVMPLWMYVCASGPLCYLMLHDC